MIDFIDKSGEIEGTPLNRLNMMAIQGFENLSTNFLDDGSVVVRNNLGHTLTTKIEDDGRITETFVGEKTITKTTVFNDDGGISEVLS